MAATFTGSQIYEIAAEAGADPRTVDKVLAGSKVRGMIGDRISRIADRIRSRAMKRGPHEEAK